MANLVDTNVNGDLRVTGTMLGTQAGNYATCATAAGTAAKSVSISGFMLTTGIHVFVKFTVTNTAAVASLTLNVSGTGAKAMRYRGGNLPAVGTLSASRVYEFIYDGSNWELVGDLDTNTQSVSGVKGNAESSYRTGQVNITPANIGVSVTATSVTVGDTTARIPQATTTAPKMNGTAAVGSETAWAKGDHVHPTDTTREAVANKSTVVLGTSDSKYPTDKAVADFVNSSVATNTANYISNNGEPFTSVEQLEAYAGTVTNNDYAFVTGTDSEGNTYYDRYKATVSGSTVTWALEYRLNNSSFTAAQWAAINSGVTSDKANYWDGKQDALTFDTTPTKGSTNPVTSDGINNALYNKINIYQNQSAKFHVKNNEYYSFVCRTKIGPWDRIQANFYGLASDSATIGSFNLFLVLGTEDTSLHTPERIALNSGIVWNLNYRGIQIYNNYNYKFYVCKSGDYFYFYAKRSNNNDRELTAFHSKLLYSTSYSIVSDISYDLDDATWQTLSLVEMKNVYTSTTQERLDAHKNDNTVHITAEERTAWNAKQAALTAGDNITIADNVISAEKQVIYAVYGKTSYDTVKNDILKGFDVVVRDQGNIYHSMWFNSTNTGDIYFESLAAAGPLIRQLILSTTGWSRSITNLQSKLTFDTTPTAGSTNPVTSGGVKTAIDAVDAKGIVINEIDGENVICFE